MTFPALTFQRLSGIEPIIGTNIRLIDYWAWTHSNLVDNTERATFAEFLVHTAMNATASIRPNWTRYDIQSPEGIKIEVKASGYLQTWAQKKLSDIVFNIRPNSEENIRTSDIYVFCLHKHTDKKTINILDTVQWTFFILKTAILNEKVREHKTITLNSLKSLGAKETDYGELRNTVIEVSSFK